MVKKSTKIVAVIMAFICFLNLKHTVLAEEIAQRIGGAYISDETYVDSNDYIEFLRIKEKDATGVQTRAGMQTILAYNNIRHILKNFL